MMGINIIYVFIYLYMLNTHMGKYLNFFIVWRAYIIIKQNSIKLHFIIHNNSNYYGAVPYQLTLNNMRFLMIGGRGARKPD